jgi:hypothetical protein
VIKNDPKINIWQPLSRFTFFAHSLFQADPDSMAELMERLQKVDSGISSESGDSQPQTANHGQSANSNSNHVQSANTYHSGYPSKPNNPGHPANHSNPAQIVNPTNPVHPAVHSVMHDHESETR